MKRNVPDEACPVVPLNRMSCVDYPPESGRCGKNTSAVVNGPVSLDGGVVVIFNSPFSLIRSRSPTTATSPEMTRSTPEKLSGSANISSRKRATWGGSPAAVFILKTLISTTEKYQRNNERPCEARGLEQRRGERIKRIVELRRRGWSTRAIAGVVGCDHETVFNELRQSLAIAIDSLTYAGWGKTALCIGGGAS